MATEQDRKDFSRRGSYRPITVPIKVLPQFSNTLNIRRPEDRAAWNKMDASLDEWRKTLQMPIGNAGGNIATPSETETEAAPITIIQQVTPAVAPQSELAKFDDLAMQNASDSVLFGIKIRPNPDGELEWFLSPKALFVRNVSDNYVYEVFIRNNPDGVPELIVGECYLDWPGGSKNTWNEVLDRILSRSIPDNIVYEIKLRNNPDGLAELFVAGAA